METEEGKGRGTRRRKKQKQRAENLCTYLKD